jgi:hypothetical protein
MAACPQGVVAMGVQQSGEPGQVEPTQADQTGLRFLSTGLAVAAIWVAVTLASVFAPDLVSGTQQEHIPIVALLAWIGGLSATKSVLSFSRRGVLPERWMWFAYAGAVGVLWAAVALVSISVPVMVTGTDPTSIPIAGIIAPFAGAAATGLIGEFVGGSHGAPTTKPTGDSAPNPA